MTMLTPELLASFDASITDVATAVTLPTEIYISEEFLAFERDAVFSKNWLCVGRSQRIPNVGDFFTTTLNEEPLIISRAKDGQIHAFSSVCRHRGMEVATGGGNCTKFVCPYHQWSYDLTGRLLGAPDMERTKDFAKSDYPLPALKVEEWQGFIFVNFDRDASPLAPTLAAFEPYLANYDLANTYTPGTFELPNRPWNWKVMFENFNDGYHANKLHHTIQEFCPSRLAGFPVDWTPDSNVIFRTNGYTHIDAGFNATTKALMPIFPGLTEEERSRSTFALIPPTLGIGTAPDQVFFFIIKPRTADSIDLEVGYQFHPSAREHPMFDYLLEMANAGVQVFIEQDTDATTKVQSGLHSKYAVRGRYSWQEESHVQFNKWLVKQYSASWPSWPS